VTDFNHFFLEKYPYLFSCTTDGHFSFLSQTLLSTGLKTKDLVSLSFYIIEGSLEIKITVESLKSRIGNVINLRSIETQMEYFGELDFDRTSERYIFLGLKANFLSHSLFQKSLLELIQLAVFPLQNPNPLLRIDSMGNLCFSNESGEKLWESLQNELQQKYDLIRQAVTTLEDRITESVQMSFSNRIFETIFVPDQTQNFVGIYFIDITKKIENEKILESQRVKLISASRLSTLGEMASGISHEINNPMSVILAQSQIIQNMLSKDFLDPEKLKKSLLKIEKMSERITKIIAGLCHFARDGEQAPMEKLKLKNCIDNVLQLCEERLSSLNLAFNVDQIPEVPVLGRAVQIEQVLLNLIMNSIQAIYHDVEKWIKISFEVENNIILIHLIDSGAKISEAIEKKLMQPFFTTKAAGSATGLGLSISHGIVQSHGGKLYLNKKFSNTCFTIELPFIEQK